MKSLYLSFILFCLVFQANAQNLPIDKESQLITYSEVVSETGTADELFAKAHKWFFSFFKNPHNVVKQKTDHQIVAHPRFKILNEPDKKGVRTMAGIVIYDIKVVFKEGRYKYTFSNFIWKQNSKFPIERWMDKSATSYSTKYESYLRQVDEKITKTIENLKEAVSQKPDKGEEDW